LTTEDRLRKFGIASEREPETDEEWNAFIESSARELDNAGSDEWLEDDEECD
jgi:hypothetical protein